MEVLRYSPVLLFHAATDYGHSQLIRFWLHPNLNMFGRDASLRSPTDCGEQFLTAFCDPGAWRKAIPLPCNGSRPSTRYPCRTTNYKLRTCLVVQWMLRISRYPGPVAGLVYALCSEDSSFLAGRGLYALHLAQKYYFYSARCKRAQLFVLMWWLRTIHRWFAGVASCRPPGILPKSLKRFVKQTFKCIFFELKTFCGSILNFVATNTKTGITFPSVLVSVVFCSASKHRTMRSIQLLLGKYCRTNLRMCSWRRDIQM